MSSEIVLAVYKPKPDCDALLQEHVRGHVPKLRELGLATDRPHIVMQAKDGTIIEVFEWVSAAAIDEAHRHPVVQELWNRFAELCTYEPPAAIPECQHIFSGFRPLDAAN